MDRKEAIQQLIAIENKPAEYNAWLQEPIVNVQEQHEEADEVLCKLLISLGYDDVVDAYRRIEKWYA
ncbi:hypothetical protein KG088_18725 [Halomonas sp. TRM85114]|uniref:hypothetical protein n=1 Tax=Halomonas jincaotanensis TaxID=2810616 RepID=UPI001BD4496B|nr:hypothetical protein [Halomonas jincaotanensis]MBS9405627.1 hypothetical protein [Halomonas jincaotanensis]